MVVVVAGLRSGKVVPGGYPTTEICRRGKDWMDARMVAHIHAYLLQWNRGSWRYKSILTYP